MLLTFQVVVCRYICLVHIHNNCFIFYRK